MSNGIKKQLRAVYKRFTSNRNIESKKIKRSIEESFRFLFILMAANILRNRRFLLPLLFNNVLQPE